MHKSKESDVIVDVHAHVLSEAFVYDLTKRSVARPKSMAKAGRQIDLGREHASRI